MKRKILLMTLLAGFVFVALPDRSFANTSPTTVEAANALVQKGWGKGQKIRRNKNRNRYHYGYKNYGQYRRTQVGNRRYRLVRRYYWRDGIRLSRWVRLYY